MNKANGLKRFRQFLIGVGVVILFFDLLDVFINPIYSLDWNNNPFCKWLLEIKEPFYMLTHLFFVIAIFWFQEVNQKKQYENQQEILKRLNDNVTQLAPLKKIEEINTTVEKWLKEDQANIIIFYFPYSIYPGFWYDTGVVFTNFINTLKTNIDQSYKSKLYFIGPDKENSPFSESITELTSKLDDKFVKDYISQNMKFFKRFDFAEFTDATKDNWAKKITDEYKNKLLELERHATDKSNNFRVLKIGADTNCVLKSSDSLPSFSFILKINKNKAEDMVLIDTFNVVAENSLTNFLKDLGISSIKTNGDSQKLLMPPISRILNNQHTANLFFTTFLETCCYSSGFQCLRDDLKNLN